MNPINHATITIKIYEIFALKKYREKIPDTKN
jgi:hypothetical protein